jgi:hypothetical protein
MKRILLVIACLVPVLAQAQTDTQWKVDGRNAVGSAANVVRLEGANGIEITSDVSGEARGVTVGRWGDLQVPVANATPATSFTPVAGSYVAPGWNILPSASPTLAVVFIEPHKMFANGKGGNRVVLSDSANPALIHPLPNASATPSSINALGVATPFSVSAGSTVECVGVSASNARCRAR